MGTTAASAACDAVVPVNAVLKNAEGTMDCRDTTVCGSFFCVPFLLPGTREDLVSYEHIPGVR